MVINRKTLTETFIFVSLSCHIYIVCKEKQACPKTEVTDTSDWHQITEIFVIFGVIFSRQDFFLLLFTYVEG